MKMVLDVPVANWADAQGTTKWLERVPKEARNCEYLDCAELWLGFGNSSELVVTLYVSGGASVTPPKRDGAWGVKHWSDAGWAAACAFTQEVVEVWLAKNRADLEKQDLV